MDVSWIESGAGGAEARAGAWAARVVAGAWRAGGAEEGARNVVARSRQADGADQRGAVRAARLRAGVAGRGEGRVDGVNGVPAELLSVARESAGQSALP